MQHIFIKDYPAYFNVSNQIWPVDSSKIIRKQHHFIEIWKLNDWNVPDNPLIKRK